MQDFRRPYLYQPIAATIRLNRRFRAFARPYPNHFFDRQHKNLTVANFARPGSLYNDIDGAFHIFICQHQLDLDFGQKINRILRAAADRQ